MKPGRQWIFFDADFFDNSFSQALTERFGWAGVGLFVAFLCACKRNLAQGKIRYRNEFEALDMMGVADLPLVDPQGVPFTLEEFWTFTGRYKQTSRTARGHTFYVSATGWEHWQKSLKTTQERERKRRSRAKLSHANVTPESETETESEKEIERASVTRTTSDMREDKDTFAKNLAEWGIDLAGETT